MTLNEELTKISSTANRNKALARVDNLYARIVEAARKEALMGKYSAQLKYNEFKEFYSDTNCEYHRIMIHEITKKLESQGLKLEYTDGADTFSGSYYIVSWNNQ